jgi:hypothetical protein
MDTPVYHWARTFVEDVHKTYRIFLEKCAKVEFAFASLRIYLYLSIYIYLSSIFYLLSSIFYLLSSIFYLLYLLYLLSSIFYIFYLLSSIFYLLYKQRSVFEARDKKRRQEARTNVKVVPLNWIVRCCGVGVVEQRIRSGELERFRVLGVSWVRLSHSTTFALSNLLDLQYFMCAARNHVKLMTMGPVPCLCLANLLFPRVEDGVRGVRGTKTAATRYLKRGFRRSRGSTTCENLVGGVSAGPSRCRAKREGSWRDARGP